MFKRLLVACLWVGLVSPVAANLVKDWSKPAEIATAQLSPSGKYLGVVKEVEEQRTVVVFEYPAMKFKSVLSYPGDNEVGGFYWATDERIVANIVRDFSGLEGGLSLGELFAMNADGSKPKHLFGYRAGAAERQGSRTSKIRNEYASAGVIDLLDADPKHILVNITYWSRGYNRVTETARLNIFTGKLSEQVRGPVSNSRMLADRNGDVRFAFSVSDDFETQIHIRDPKTREWSLFSKFPYGEGGVEPIMLAEDGRIYVRKGINDGPEGIYLLDPKTQETELVYQHDLVRAGLMRDRQYNVFGVLIHPDKPEFVPLDKKHPRTRLLVTLQKLFPDAVPYIVSATADNSKLVAAIDNPSKTTEYYIYDRESKKLELLFDARPDFDDSLLGTMKPISFETRDGLTLHGYLTVPTGHEAKNLPLLLVPHGGPHGPRDFWGFDWFTGILPAAGYAILQVNFRGSGGYGIGFERAGFREWAGKMQDDLTDATNWAVGQGIADPERLCVFGWSYGGYATLMSIIREPKLYKCAVAGAGVYDQDIQYTRSDFAQGSRWGKKYVDRVIGPTEQDRRLASPTNYVEKIQTPLFLIHGEEDRRVPIEHLDALLKAMKKAKLKKPQVLRLNKEGHSPRSQKNNEKMWRQVLKFLEDHIGKGVEVKPAQTAQR